MKGLKIVAVSDLHIGFREQNKPDEFMDFMDSICPSIDYMILCGDVFELWRRDLCGTMIENSKFVHALSEAYDNYGCEIILIAGNHDWHLTNMGFTDEYALPFRFDEKVEIHDDYTGTDYLFLHGNQFDAPCANKVQNEMMCFSNDVIGREWAETWEQVRKPGKLFKWPEKLKMDWDIRSKMPGIPKIPIPNINILSYVDNPGVHGIDRQETVKDIAVEYGKGAFVIYGHTHHPFLDLERGVANTGTWIRGRSDYILINDNEITLNSYL